MTHPFQGYAEHFDQEVRLVILRALNEDDNGTMNDSMLFTVLQTFGIVKDRDYLRTQLRWLQDNARAVILRPAGTALVATLTEQGENHVERRFVIDGIKKPSRPRA